MRSLNFSSGWAWLREEKGQVQDTYKLLDPLFVDESVNTAVAQGENEEIGERSFIANGGAAKVAYSELQNPDLAGDERRRIKDQLKRYCELDTLAMVMVYQALKAWLNWRG